MHQVDAPIWVWIVFILGIDVSHVWSTLFRTYLDKEEFQHHKQLLVLTPLIAFSIAFCIASISIFWFWRILAYVALFHFIKQQYGFMRIYKAKSGDFTKQYLKDDWILYLSMLYPVLYWHLAPTRQFSWFLDGDFFAVNGEFGLIFFQIANALYFLILLAWLVQELLKGKAIPAGKVIWVLTTAGNWFIGIVYFNSDLVFTITNVVAHGVPYIALVLFYQHEKSRIFKGTSNILLPIILVTSILVLAIGEEFLWDLLINREKEGFFGALIPYFETPQSIAWIAFFTAFLSLPQITHYILDGFIWKNTSKNPHLKKILIGK